MKRDLTDRGPYATKEDKAIAKDCGVTVQRLRYERAAEDAVCHLNGVPVREPTRLPFATRYHTPPNAPRWHFMQPTPPAPFPHDGYYLCTPSGSVVGRIYPGDVDGDAGKQMAELIVNALNRK